MSRETLVSSLVNGNWGAHLEAHPEGVRDERQVSHQLATGDGCLEGGCFLGPVSLPLGTDPSTPQSCAAAKAGRVPGPGKERGVGRRERFSRER